MDRYTVFGIFILSLVFGGAIYLGYHNDQKKKLETQEKCLESNKVRLPTSIGKPPRCKKEC